MQRFANIRSILVVLVLVVLSPTATIANECRGEDTTIVRLSQAGSHLFAARFAAVFTDPGGQLGYEEILAADAAGRFDRHCRPDLAPPPPGDALWVRLDLERPDAAPADWVLSLSSLQIDEARVYQIRENGLFVLKRTGRAVPKETRDMVSRWPAVGVSLTKGRTARVYLRLSGITTPFISIELVEAKQFANDEAVDLLTVAGIIGFLIAMLAFNIVIYVRSRLHQCIFYCAYLTFMALHIVVYDGLIYRFLDVRLTGQQADWFSQIAGLAAAICIVMFGRLLLRLPTVAPRTDRVILWLTLLIVPVTAGEMVGIIPFFIGTSMLPIVLGLILAGTSACFAIKGNRPAIYFLFSFLALLAGVILDTLGYFYPVAVTAEPGIWTGIIGVQQNWSFHIGICAEALLITFAITYFIRDMQTDVIDARAEADQTRQETVAARREFTEKYTDLAQRVGIRPVDKDVTTSSADAEFRDHVTRVVQDNLGDETFDVAKLADSMAMSERTLRRRIREAADVSPVEFLRRQRLERARAHLENGSYHTVAEVARAVGINSPGYFSRIYRQAFDQSPRDALKTPRT